MRSSGANGPVYAIAHDANTNVIVAGDFSAVNTISRSRIARLTSTGQVDSGFNPIGGANNTIASAAVYTNSARSGQVIIGGGFTAVNGELRNGVARLATNGAVDLNFKPGRGVGPNEWVYAVALQKDGKILAGGNFTSFNGVPRNGIVRLLDDGSVDLGFDPGLGVGPGESVFAIYPQAVAPLIITNSVTNGQIATFTRDLAVGTNSGFLNLSFNFFGASNDIVVLRASSIVRRSTSLT